MNALKCRFCYLKMIPGTDTTPSEMPADFPCPVKNCRCGSEVGHRHTCESCAHPTLESEARSKASYDREMARRKDELSRLASDDDETYAKATAEHYERLRIQQVESESERLKKTEKN